MSKYEQGSLLSAFFVVKHTPTVVTFSTFLCVLKDCCRSRGIQDSHIVDIVAGVCTNVAENKEGGKYVGPAIVKILLDEGLLTLADSTFGYCWDLKETKPKTTRRNNEKSKN